MTQSLVPKGSWMSKQPIEEREPGEMSLQPGPHANAQLIQKESSVETRSTKLYMLISQHHSQL